MADEFEQQYPPLVTTPAQARLDITEYLGTHGLPTLVPMATLLVSELVTNSVLHATGPIAMRARVTESCLHVDVDDGSSTVPRMRTPGLGGRGLHIVEAVAAAWGVAVDGTDGKSTWFELRVP